ncbi:elafin [Echinops telfairi]|uniref:Elafin n=1 Tax=Echinops telfairi TaxID=9371 RepID=D3DMB9_ECHTE|nr:elafin [Echinops telfairi]FAA00670.1 TPA: trappin-2 [Echinops telfairi]
MRSTRLMLTVLGTLAVVLVLGSLAVEAAVVEVPVKGQVLVKGQDPVKRPVPIKGQDPIKGGSSGNSKPGSCPEIRIRCAMLNPPNRCLSDAQCPQNKKCCVGACGKACLAPQ